MASTPDGRNIDLLKGVRVLIVEDAWPKRSPQILALRGHQTESGLGQDLPVWRERTHGKFTPIAARLCCSAETQNCHPCSLLKGRFSPFARRCLASVC